MFVEPNLTIKQILDRLVSANTAYRNGTPTMLDAEYDALEDRLVELVDGADESFVEVREAKAFLATIGAPVGDSGWTKVRHASPMGSLNKAQNENDFRGWYASCGHKGTSLIVSDKADGISCFDENTPVHLANGEMIPIGQIVRENLRPSVLTWSPESGLGTSKITAVHDNGPREGWIRLLLEDGSKILVTENHLFYVKNKGWVPAKSLLGEDIVEPAE